jgi:hypothetical protein
MIDDVNCPYCGAPQEINHDDGRGYSEDDKHEQQCNECEKIFVFTTSISYYYEAEKADCLNDGEHNYKRTHTIPRGYTKMRCTMCDEQRKPTEEEMKQILLEDVAVKAVAP